MLPYIYSMYDTGFKVLSIKIKYFAPFKYKHKHQKHAHENQLPNIPSLHWMGVMTFSIKNNLPYICSMYDTGIKVLSMKINSLAPSFKHKHKHQKFSHENNLPRIPWLHGIGVMTFSMKISYITSAQCMTQVSKCYP